MSEIDAKLSSKIDTNTLDNLVNTIQDQTIIGFEAFTSNLSATGFVKTCKDDSSVLIAGGGDQLLSSFGRIEDLTSSAFSNMNEAVISNSLNRIGNPYIFQFVSNRGNYNAGTFNPDNIVQHDTAVATYIPFPNMTFDKCSYVSITHSTGLITLKSISYTYTKYASATWVK
ncbi:MAG: hypothetical protein EZS28_021551 [Streblomastix strix]|uniref:Uncharacterized protein n=1 Tax=Streblomastix strix TaxID=222440 RepID=A0A5J4VKB9_9EUKA|nr:MAG: hypothetical protein EZS28_021551 [Streblomastix strix]